MQEQAGEQTAGTEEELARPSLWQLALVFLKVGATGFGGAMPVLALVQNEVVEKRGWVSREEFSEAVMIGQIMPGPIAVDAVTHMSYRLRGWPGAVVSAVSFILPSFIFMLGLTILYLNYGQIPQLTGVLKGVGAAVVAIIAATAYRMAKPFIRDRWGLLLMLAAALALLVVQVNVVLVIVVAGLAGLVLYRGQAVPLPGGNSPARKGAGR